MANPVPFERAKQIIFNSYNDHNFDPAECLNRCYSEFEQACGAENELDPRNRAKAERACNEAGAIARIFSEGEYTYAAESFLIKAWNLFSQIQFETRHRIYRAGLAMYLSRLYEKLGDKGAALRWALLTQAADILGNHQARGGAGRQMLLTILRVTEPAIEAFNSIGDENRGRISANENDWSKHYAYPEDVVRRFALEKPQFAHYFALPTLLGEFPLNPAYFSAFREWANGSHSNTSDQGTALEDLASYLFLLIPGWVPRQKLLDEREAYETDLVVRNLNISGNLTAELLGRYFIVECKNWSSQRPAVHDVGYFLYRMRLTHANFGVIFSRNDITGLSSIHNDERASYQLIRKAFHEDGSICVVISNNDINAILSRENSFWPILLEKIERVRFGTQRSTRII